MVTRSDCQTKDGRLVIGCAVFGNSGGLVVEV
jgi:hypothetical protein